MAKKPVAGARGGAKKGGSRGKGPAFVLVLVGFVVLAIGVTGRRVYGLKQEEALRGMNQRREALISEEQKLQDAIRVASDRKHIMEVAQTRLNMRMPDLNQIVDLPRRPLVRRDSIKR